MCDHTANADADAYIMLDDNDPDAKYKKLDRSDDKNASKLAHGNLSVNWQSHVAPKPAQ